MSIVCQKDYKITVVTPVPNLYWKFEEPTGPWFDQFQHAEIDQTLPTVTSGTPALIQNGLKLHGDDPVVNTADPPIVYPASNGCSFTIWIKFYNRVAGDIIDGAVLLYNIGNNSSIAFEVKAFASTLHTIMLVEVEDVSSNFFTNQVDVGPVANNVWYFFAFTFAQPSKLTTFYFNGVSVGTTTSTVTPTATSLLSIDINASTGGAAKDLIQCDEMGVWINHVLTSSEVSQMWNGGAGARPPGV